MRYCWFPFVVLLLVSSAQAQQVSQADAYAELSPAKPSGLQSPTRHEGLSGKVVTGYQGWFRAEGDGAGMGFHHYRKGRRFAPGSCTIDMWPDMSEYSTSERFDTPFRHQDGRVAQVFSSIVPQTIDRHFLWMKQYGIDSAFVQRFAVHGAKPHRDFRGLKYENRKLLLARDAAIKHGRSWVLMYDLSGMKDDDFERLAADWKQLRTKMQLGTDPNDASYLQLNGKPLVAIWGVGFGDDRQYSLEKAAWFVRLLKHNPEWGGMSIMLGVPYHWREQRGDATDDPNLHAVLKLADVISPWSVGRYRDMQTGTRLQVLDHQRADRKWCQSQGIEYLPVLWPGFSWKNMNGPESSSIPRRGGEFFWNQFQVAAMAGNDAAYLAMFDEVDEATAIFKVTNDPPRGESSFQTYEGQPSDHYLWLSGQGGKLLRGELPDRIRVPLPAQ